MLGFSSRANWRNCCTARCWSIWYRLFIATLSFSWQKKPPSAHYDRGCESRYFLRINGHPHQQWRSKYFHLAMRRGRKIAKVAMARRLAIQMYWMMRKEWDYEQVKKFGSHAGQPGNTHGVQ